MKNFLLIVLIIFSGLLLFGAFLTLSVFVSSLTQRSSSSFLILLVAWVFTVMVMPRISALVVGRVVDVPSTEYLASLKWRFGAQLSTENRNLIANYRSTEQSDMQKMMVDMHGPGYTGDADIDFLVMMIPHHQGAVDMARLVLIHGKDPLTRKLADEIIASQNTEIAAMRARRKICGSSPDSSVRTLAPAGSRSERIQFMTDL